MNALNWIKNLVLDLLFPLRCINCEEEGSCLCEDCRSLIEVLENLYCPVCGKRLASFNYNTFPEINETEKESLSGICPACRKKTELDGLYCAASLQNPIVRKLIGRFGHPPFVRELARPLAGLTVTHLRLSRRNFAEYIMIPQPRDKKETRRRGFDPAEEIAKEVSKNLKMALALNSWVKTGKGAFALKNPETVKNKKVLLVNDFFPVNSPMAECAVILKETGAKEVWGTVAARE